MRTKRPGRDGDLEEQRRATKLYGCATARSLKKVNFSCHSRRKKELKDLRRELCESLMNDEGGNAFYGFCHCRPRLSKSKAVKPSSLLANTRFAA
jgi:hypothetical protein